MQKQVSNFEVQIDTDPKNLILDPKSRIVYTKTGIQTRVQIFPDHGVGDYEFIKPCQNNGYSGLFRSHEQITTVKSVAFALGDPSVRKGFPCPGNP